MNLSNIIYYIKTGINDAKHNSAMSVSAIIIVIAGLCVLGIYSIFSTNISYISAQLCSRYTVTAYIEKGVPEERTAEIQQEIKNIDGVKEVEYISEHDALIECREMFGDEAGFLDGLDEENPLRASMIITVKDISQSDNIAETAGEITDVAWVKEDSGLADKLVSSTSFARKGSVILMAVFFLISLFIIASTIRITILAKQNDIHTMRYLGATNRFIVIPFVIEGIIIGIIGAVIAYCITLPCYAYVASKLIAFIGDTIRIYRASDMIFILAAEYIVSGVIIGGLSAVFPLVKYMKV